LFEIEVALRSGKTHKQIWQRLSDAGLDITCETFCRLIRGGTEKSAHIRGAGRETCRSPELHAQQTATVVEHDPLSQSPESRSVQGRVFIFEVRKTWMSWCVEEGNPMSKANAEREE